MAIPSRQIGQSPEANLLWQISKQLEQLIAVTSKANQPVAYAYSEPLSFPISYISFSLQCDGSGSSVNVYTNQTANNIAEAVSIFNANLEAKAIGKFSAVGSNVLALTTTDVIKNANCPTGTLTLNVYSD